MNRYDVIFFDRNVFIGMEDVSVTYGFAEREQNLSLEQAKNILLDAADEFADLPISKKRAAGEKGYYPDEFPVPCAAAVIPHIEGEVPFRFERKSWDIEKGVNKCGGKFLYLKFTKEENAKMIKEELESFESKDKGDYQKE